MKIQVLSTTDQDFAEKFSGRVFDVDFSDGLTSIETKGSNGETYKFSPNKVIREDNQPLDPSELAIEDVLILSSDNFVVRSKVVLLDTQNAES